MFSWLLWLGMRTCRASDCDNQITGATGRLLEGFSRRSCERKGRPLLFAALSLRLMHPRHIFVSMISGLDDEVLVAGQSRHARVGNWRSHHSGAPRKQAATTISVNLFIVSSLIIRGLMPRLTHSFHKIRQNKPYFFDGRSP